jgi:hypothetical protein
MLPTKRLVLACAATATLGLVLAPAATATSQAGLKAGADWSRTLSTEVGAPFNIAVQGNAVYVADGATNEVSRIEKGVKTHVASGLSNPNSEVARVATNGAAVAYTTSSTDDSGFVHTAAEVVIMRGDRTVRADLLAYEQAHNPDGNVQYGLAPGTDCVAGRGWLDVKTFGAGSYTGIEDTHPPSVTSLPGNAWAVADAGANAILRVSSTGQVSTLAVLPPQTATISEATLQALAVDDMGNPEEVPDDVKCLVGKTYAFEPVPTDVEVGPAGQLSVSLLPGGPEDPSLGARGAVYRVNPATGASTRWATGFSAATNLAVHGDATTYVTELFGGKVSQISPSGAVSTFKELGVPLAVEVHGTFVYVATAGIFGPTGQGEIIQYRR